MLYLKADLQEIAAKFLIIIEDAAIDPGRCTIIWKLLSLVPDSQNI